MTDVQLFKAVQDGDVSLVRDFCRAGAQVNAKWSENIPKIYPDRDHKGCVPLFVEEEEAGVRGVCTCVRTEYSPLFSAAANGHIECVRVLLELGADINSEDNYGATPVWIAAQNGHFDCISLLCELGANVTTTARKDKSSPLYAAAYMGHTHCIRLLHQLGCDLNSRDSAGRSPVLVAAKMNRPEAIKVMHELGADIHVCKFDGASPIYMAAQDNHVECIRLLLQLGGDVNLAAVEGDSPIWVAAQNGHAACVQVLLDAGANPNACDQENVPPVSIACLGAHLECIRLLHKYGADLNKTHSEDNRFPLYVASWEGKTDCVRLLYELGADISARSIDGSSCLHIAAEQGRAECIRVLHELGLDVNIRDNSGACPVHLAAYFEQPDCVRVLHELGADIEATDQTDSAPVHEAAYSNSIECIKVLHELKASINRRKSLLTPIIMAAIQDRKEAVQCLLKLGAVISPKDLSSVWSRRIKFLGMLSHVNIIVSMVKLFLQTGSIEDFDEGHNLNCVLSDTDEFDQWLAYIIQSHLDISVLEKSEATLVIARTFLWDIMKQCCLPLLQERKLEQLSAATASESSSCAGAGVCVEGSIPSICLENAISLTKSINVFMNRSCLETAYKLRMVCSTTYRGSFPVPAQPTLELPAGIIEKFVVGEVSIGFPTAYLRKALLVHNSHKDYAS